VAHNPQHGGAGTRQALRDIADIFRRHGEEAHARFNFNPAQRSVMRHIIDCRTAALGGHLYFCPCCHFERPAYNSCLDRHCPKCQAIRQAQWLDLRLKRVLPVGHYHIVFTLPGLLRPLAKRLPRRVYELLFKAASQTLNAFANDPKWLGAQLGITAVLHTWTRDLRLHPHLHCVVTAGGLARDGLTWITPRHTKILFPVHALAKVFRGKVLDALANLDMADRHTANLADDDVLQRLVDRLYRTRWVVYAKRPFATADHVFKYLGQYTHRVAISNHRIIAINERAIHFATKGGRSELLPPTVFIRRFLDHVLPDRFTKIRHYGLYASSNVHGRLEQARVLLIPAHTSAPAPSSDPPSPDTKVALLIRFFGPDFLRCPACGQADLVPIASLPKACRARGPP
jgi:hypothetical protein